ncbi:MAG: ABC transporter substrate-binding protein [Deltaproteobacteria bacterium]|nr:ABC transporter substrate-binding protein [Deltaproteobacteria bacterium]
MQRRKMIWSLIGAGAIVAAAVAVFFILETQREEPIKIGAIISLTGPAGHLVDVRDGMQLAVDEVNTWGGVNGRKIELIVEDSKSSKEEGEKAFERIEARDHPLLYVAVTSSGSMAAAPLAEKNEVVLVGLVTTTPELTKQKEWVFKYYYGTKDEVRPILNILKHLRVKKLGILYQDDAYGTPVSDLLGKKSEKSGIAVVAEPFAVKNPDLQPKISKLKDTDAIYVVGFVKNEAKAIRLLRKEKYPGFILGAAGVTNLMGKMPEVDGVYVASPLIYNPDFVFAREVRDKYEIRYGRPFTHQAANGYDFVKLVAALLEEREVSRESIREVLEGGFIHPGIFGELDIKPGNHEIDFPLHPARIEKGKIKFLNLY